jgi:hypothetical protein
MSNIKIEKILKDMEENRSFDDALTSFVYKPPLSATNLLKSDSETIRRFMNCNWDEVFILNFSSEESFFLSKLENISDLAFDRFFAISGNRWEEKTKSFYRIPGENVPVLHREYGFLVRRSDWDKVKTLISSIRLSPSNYNTSELDLVFWDDRTKSLRNDVVFFSNSKKWFDKRDLPYSRSYLLYGPPGNGKTSAIRAISEYFNTTPSQFSFTGRYEDPDSAFLHWISGEDNRPSRNDYAVPPMRPAFDQSDLENSDNPRIRVLLLEDIDRFFSREEGFKTPVSFSAILNALDGVIQRNNSILIATANNPEKIDSQVLFRPGRFDLRIPFSAPDRASMISFIEKLSEADSVSTETIEKVADSSKGHSFAFAKGVYMAAANKAFARASEVISDDDMLCSLTEFLSNMGKDIKSTKLGTGF